VGGKNSPPRGGGGVTEKNATFAFSQKTHTNATFK